MAIERRYINDVTLLLFKLGGSTRNISIQEDGLPPFTIQGIPLPGSEPEQWEAIFMEVTGWNHQQQTLFEAEKGKIPYLPIISAMGGDITRIGFTGTPAVNNPTDKKKKRIISDFIESRYQSDNGTMKTLPALYSHRLLGIAAFCLAIVAVLIYLFTDGPGGHLVTGITFFWALLLAVGWWRKRRLLTKVE